ncbi:PREDICTED: BZIP mRNAion factor [Prunus dulcis]|uniref:PREDICTED: BZIP mRNAion factor n=1 Tax=Prunus dulcis TaxID=3755 RepID=A0A5E4ECS0_PRUDU|nr:nitrate regulatory gene2 protein [Prunus dulcis]XP_034198860.1 nitrate regulatory gene2 protein [Prunus dulcis]XP_034198861.1 nitrate regulatory gene2 protein [Prunus dulcis]VVA13563.1 PREDICTED: BZIP mRNAion factor [Prunus dulcis]
MGCGGSKVDNLPLVTFCRERKDFIKTASDTRYALAAAHLSYFHSLKHIGDALCKFVDEDLIISGAGGSSSPPGSPVLTLPSDEGKPRRHPHKNDKHSSSSTSISHSVSVDSPKEEDIEDSHLHLSSGSGSDSDLDSPSGHIHIEESPEQEVPSSSSYGYPPTSHMYYMRRSGTPMQTVSYEEPGRYPAQNGPYPDPYPGYSDYQPYGGGGFFGYPMGSPMPSEYPYNRRPPSPPPSDPPPAPPSPPKTSTWDFLNVFDTFDNSGYLGYNPRARYGYGSTTSSPDSKEVREREGIPELEDETEQEVMKEVHKEKRKANEDGYLSRNRNSGEGTSRGVRLQQPSSEGSSGTVPLHSSDGSSGTVPLHSSERSSGTVPLHSSESSHSVQGKEIKSSPDTIGSKNSEEEGAKKKRVSFEFEAPSTLGVGSSKGSSLTTLSVHGTRDLQEVVKEIRDEFETASSYGKEVAMLLEVGKLPYQPRGAALKVIFSRILYLVAPSMLSSQPPSGQPVRLTSKTMKMAKAYQGEPGKDFNKKSGNLSSTLEKLYAWEKKLYKEVKDEEKLRVDYEKKCKRLKSLDYHGAESAKIDATQASVRKLLTKIDVCIRAVDTISSRIHKLRDEELLPQVTELIHGLIRMWKSMLKCHQKQFQAIMESKIRSLKVNTGLRRDSGLKATLELEMELLKWCTSFNNWVNTQKSYVESLNGWLLKCINQEPEVTPDGVAPFSPSRMGAPPIFVVCNDWCQAMERISEKGVADAMHDFASTLHQLWERQDEEQRQRIKAEYVSKNLESQLRKLRMERAKREHDHDAATDKTALSKAPSESGVSPLDDLKVDLDLMRKRLSEEKARHKEAIKLVNHAASNSLQAGLVPIFESLNNFTSEALKVHELVRLQDAGGS